MFCETTELLLRAGATIEELNGVRKHLDLLKGGRLAQIAAPARILALLLSDVLGDRPEVIASGPLSPDPTKFSDALATVDRHQSCETGSPPRRSNIWSPVHGARCGESPGPDAPFFADVEVQIVGSNRMAAYAALQEAERRGYRTRLVTTTLSGEAKEVGRMLAAQGLEIRGRSGPDRTSGLSHRRRRDNGTRCGVRGRGGRNQELVIGAALALHGSGASVVGVDGDRRYRRCEPRRRGLRGPDDDRACRGARAERSSSTGCQRLDSLLRSAGRPHRHRVPPAPT